MGNNAPKSCSTLIFHDHIKFPLVIEQCMRHDNPCKFIRLVENFPRFFVHNPQKNNVSLEFHKAVTFYRTVINDVPHDHLASPTVFQSQ